MERTREEADEGGGGVDEMPPGGADAHSLFTLWCVLTFLFLLSIAFTHSFFHTSSSSRSSPTGYSEKERRRTAAIRLGDNCRLPLVPITFDTTRSSLVYSFWTSRAEKLPRDFDVVN
ncbi:hypothetical protein BpHYR1_040241, partial [Brachionus plicatilis]